MEKRDKKIIFALFSFVLVFILILILLKFDIILPSIDKKISDFFFFNQTDSLLLLMKSLSFLVSVGFMVCFSLIIIGIFYFNEKIKTALFYAYNVLIGVVFELVIKGFVKRERPVNPFENDFSFPSGHAMVSLLAYGSLAYAFWNVNRKISYCMLAVPLLVGFSRIYMRAHWLSDVLAGYVLAGFLLVSSIWMFFDRK